MDTAKLTTEDKKNLNTIIKNNELKYNQDIADLEKKQIIKKLNFQKTLIALELEASQKGSDLESSLLMQQINNSREIELAGIEETGEQKIAKTKAINAKFNKLQEDENNRYINQFLDEKLAQESQSLVASKIQELQSLKEKRNTGIITKKEYNKKLLEIDRQYVQDSLQIAIDHAQSELDLLIASGEDTTQAQEALNDLKLKKQDAATFKETENPKWTPQDTLNTAADSAQMIADATFQISRDNNQRELDAKLTQLATLKDAELSSKRLTESQKDSINAKWAAKEKALKQKAWKQQHKADLAQAWINMALAIGKAAINVWPLPAIPMMAMAALSGGLQIAAVSSQKMPEFLEGGFTKQDANNLAPAGFVHANEYVIPAAGVKNPHIRPFLDTLEMARLNKSLPTLNPSLLTVPPSRFISGGYTSHSSSQSLPTGILPGANNSIPDMATAMNRFADAVTNLQKNGVQGKWSLFDLEKIQKNKSQLESASNM